MAPSQKLVHSFSPGPAALPTSVLTQIQNELLDTFGMGMSILEVSHRSKQYETLNAETLSLAREVFEVPSTHSLLFMPVGAQHHFSLIISHLSLPGETIAYTDTGIWAHLAVTDALNSKRNVATVYDGQPHYTSLGNPLQWDVPRNAKYLHLTVNNTVYGTEYPRIPDHFETPLVLDMTSSLASRRDIPWNKTGLIYASAQKNFGIAGVSAIIIRNDLLQRCQHNAAENLLGNALNYVSNFNAKSALNTPPVFALFVTNRMLQWMKKEGGVAEMERRALTKAKLIYDEVDAGFFVGRCEKPYRSRHNFVFKLPTSDLDERFIAEAAKHNIFEIKGYRSVGGIRASAYNGVSVESTEVLANFMNDFRKRHG